MAKYRVETDNGTYEVETEEAPQQKPIGEQPASFSGVAQTMGQQAGHALSTAASDIAGAPAALYNTIRHPISTLSQMAEPRGNTPESELPQDPMHRFQRFLGGGPNYHPLGLDTPGSEIAGHGLALGAMAAAPIAAPKAAESAMERVPQGFNLAHPDVRAGGAKLAVGTALTEALPGALKWPVRVTTMYPALRQFSRGIFKPDAYADESVGELPTIKPPAQQGAAPAVFGDPEGFAKLPASVQEAILRGQGTVNAPAAGKPLPGPLAQPIDIGEPQRSLQPPAPVVPLVERPTTVDITGTLDKMKAEQGISPGKHLGEVPRGSYPERWDEGAPTPTVRSTMSKTKYIRVNPEDVGVHGGVENTPIKGPLNTPEKLKIARDLANELKKSSKGGK